MLTHCLFRLTIDYNLRKGENVCGLKSSYRPPMDCAGSSPHTSAYFFLFSFQSSYVIAFCLHFMHVSLISCISFWLELCFWHFKCSKNSSRNAKMAPLQCCLRLRRQGKLGPPWICKCKIFLQLYQEMMYVYPSLSPHLPKREKQMSLSVGNMLSCFDCGSILNSHWYPRN